MARLFQLMLTLSLSISFIPAFAQSEYFVEVDPSTGNFNKISKIPGANWINPNVCAYDEIHHLYFFAGSPDAKNWYLYTIDATTGKTLNSPLISFTDTISSIYNLHYNSANNTIYCIHYNGLQKKLFLTTLNPQTAERNDIKALIGPRFGVGYSTIDYYNNLIYAIVPDTVTKLYTIDITTGNIVNKATVPSTLNNITYNNKTNKLIGIYSKRDTALSVYTEFLVSVNPQTGDVNIINNLSGVASLLGVVNDYLIKETQNEFIAVLFDSNKTPRLYTYNIDSGKKLYDPFFYQVRSDSDNVICFQFDNTLNKLFAIHWEAKNEYWQYTNDSMTVYPNPFVDETEISLRKSYKNITINLFNESRKYISTFFYTNVPSALIKRNGLPSGIYYAVVYDNFGYLGTVKLVAR